MKRKLLTFVLVLMCLLTFFTPTVSAVVIPNDTVMPCYENVVNTNFNFRTTSSGQLYVSVGYYGNSATFTQAKITVEIEKRFLGLFWRTVDIGYEDDLWVAYSTVCNGNFINTFAADGTDAEYGWPDRVTVIPGIYGSASSPVQPFGSSVATEVVVSVPFYETNADLHDWGLIRLSNNIGRNSGYVGFEYSSTSMVTDLEDPYSMISGYPGDRNGHNGTENGSFQYYNQYCAFDVITSDNSGQTTLNNTTYEYRLLRHTIDATSGQSGSAVLCASMTQPTGFVIQGVYIGGLNSSTNAALGITGQMFSFLLGYKGNS